jgi:hypothetical protein
MPKPLKLTIRFHPGQDDDLIDWLGDMQTAYGKKGEAIKDALRRGLGTTSGGSSAPPIDTGSLLADIRLMFESALASHTFQPAAQRGAEDGQAQLVEERLALLDQNLSLDPQEGADSTSVNPLPSNWS